MQYLKAYCMFLCFIFIFLWGHLKHDTMQLADIFVVFKKAFRLLRS